MLQSIALTGAALALQTLSGEGAHVLLPGNRNRAMHMSSGHAQKEWIQNPELI